MHSIPFVQLKISSFYSFSLNSDMKIGLTHVNGLEILLYLGASSVYSTKGLSICKICTHM